MTPAPTSSPPEGFEVSLQAESGCKVTATATKENEDWHFDAQTGHISSAVCQCPRGLQAAACLANEEKIWRHAFGAWQAGKCDVEGLLSIFARHVLGMPVENGLGLRWDAENRTWSDVQQSAEAPETKARTTFSGQATSGAA
ncbi:hypothetical protein F4778DRAFT_725457 [Xylariomycetidae sp. FL2044]|nr:hypothetical protein F4778DRAFT_725457 [Xylariomycetidae sp. FL2044]